jgi:hypothetical protein
MQRVGLRREEGDVSVLERAALGRNDSSHGWLLFDHEPQPINVLFADEDDHVKGSGGD